MIAEDLAPLIAPSSKLDDLGFHQGKVLAWNKSTGQNTIEVGGTPLVDLPMLNLGDTVNIAAGDVVGLVRYKSTIFIVGRIVLPQSEALASGAVLPATGTVSASGYAIAAETTVVSESLTAPPWSDAVTVFATIHATGRNNRGVVDFMYTRVKINGFSGQQQFGQADASPNPSFANASASMSASGLLPGGTSFLVEGTVNSNAGDTWAANVLNQCDLTYSVMYFKV